MTTGILVGVVAGCAGQDQPPAGPAPSTAAAAPAATASAAPAVPSTSAGGKARALPVYFVADTPAGFRLQREFHRVTTPDPATDAVHEMFGGALDPDYLGYWPAGTALRSPVVAAGGVITVDLTGPATGAPSDPAAAGISLQQLVFTVQGALQSSDPVRLLVDGAPADQVLGGVDVRNPVPRGDVYAVRSLVQIDEPAEGATVGREVVVSGEAAVFEATVHWEVRQAGRVVVSGFTNSAEGQVFAPYRFTVPLEPGEYEVRVTEDDPSDGAGRPPLSDTRTITVA